MKKKVLSFVVVLSMLSAMLLVPMSASDVTSGDYTYTVTDGYATITGYTGSEANLTIPSEIDGYTVKVIGQGAFSQNSTLQTVVLPDTVETIERLAFENCTFSSIDLPDSVTSISMYAFAGAKLTYINLPSSLTTINSLTFICPNLAYARIPHTVTSINSFAFSACRKDLTIVGCANSAAQTYAEEKGFTFATIPCKDHTFSGGVCTCCGILLGDLNKDGVVNTEDYTIIIGYIDDPSTCPDLSIADVNQDGVLDINDRLFLLEIISGISTWPE